MRIPGNPVLGRPLEVSVGEGGVEKAVRRLKRKVMAEGVLRDVKRKRYYEKPSQRRKRKQREAERRRRRNRRTRTDARGRDER